MKRMLVVIAVVALTTGCAMTTGQRLAEKAAPQPKSYAEALKTCMEGQTSNQAVITACTAAVLADASRTVGTANAAAAAENPCPWGCYGSVVVSGSATAVSGPTRDYSQDLSVPKEADKNRPSANTVVIGTTYRTN